MSCTTPGVGVGVAVGVRVGVRVGEGVQVRVAEGVAVGDAEGDAVAVGDGVGVGILLLSTMGSTNRTGASGKKLATTDRSLVIVTLTTLEVPATAPDQLPNA